MALDAVLDAPSASLRNHLATGVDGQVLFLVTFLTGVPLVLVTALVSLAAPGASGAAWGVALVAGWLGFVVWVLSAARRAVTRRRGGGAAVAATRLALLLTPLVAAAPVLTVLLG